MAKALAVHLHMVPRCEMSQHHSAFSAFSAHHFFLGFIHFLKPKLVSFKWAIMKHMAAILSSDVFFWGNPGGGLPCHALPTDGMEETSGAALPPQLLPHLGVPRSPATQAGDSTVSWS